MSQEIWDSATDKERDVIAEVAEVEQKADEASCKTVREADAEVSVLPAAECDKIKAAGKASVDAEWTAQVEKAGADADSLYQEYRSTPPRRTIPAR